VYKGPAIIEKEVAAQVPGDRKNMKAMDMCSGTGLMGRVVSTNTCAHNQSASNETIDFETQCNDTISLQLKLERVVWYGVHVGVRGGGRSASCGSLG
jgi:hypothetical protein